MVQLTCKSCGLDKSHVMFHKDSRIKRGYKHICKACLNNKGKPEKGPGETKPKEPVVEEKKVGDKKVEEKKDGEMVDPMDPEHAEGKFTFPSYPQFKIEEVMEEGTHYAMAFVASRNSGKTTAIAYFQAFFRTFFDFIVLFCNSLQADIYKFLNPVEKKFSFEDFTPAVLKDIERVQKKTHNAFDWLIEFDDCVNLTNVKYSDDILQLYTRGRNKKMSVLFSMQSPMFINKNSRGNIDLLFILNLRTAEMVDAVITHFLYNVIPVPPDVKTKTAKYSYYYHLIKEKTKDRGILIIDYLHDNAVYEFKVPEEFVKTLKKEKDSEKEELERKKAEKPPTNNGGC